MPEQINPSNEPLSSRLEELEAINQQLMEENKALKQAGEKLQRAVENCPVSIVITDSSGTIEYVNPHFTRLTGYEIEEAIGQNPRILKSGQTPESVYKDMWKTISTGQEWCGEFLNVNKYGELFWEQASMAPIQNEEGEITHYVCVKENITERREAAIERERLLEEARQQRELLDAIISSVSEGILVADEQGRYLCFNKAAETIFGHSHEAGDCLDAEKCLVHFEAFDMDGSPLEKEGIPLFRAMLGETMTDEEFIVKHGGKELTVSVNGRPLKSESHEGGVATVRDVTKHRMVEKQLSQAQKMESIGQLSAGVAHEINTPMQYISDNLQFLGKCSEKLFVVVDRYRELLDDSNALSWQSRQEEIDRISAKYRFDFVRDELPQAIEDCSEGIERTIKIVRAMKDFSHPGDIRKTEVRINELIESTVAITRNRWKDIAAIKLDLAELPEVLAYPAELNQVLLNLVINAIDAIAEKFAEGEIGQIVVRTRRVSNKVEIVVGDNGCGIPPVIRERIFDPFFTTKELGQGTGQGLTLTHNIVTNMHGGVIDVESEVGQGTTFKILLPIDELAEPAPEEVLQESEC